MGGKWLLEFMPTNFIDNHIVAEQAYQALALVDQQMSHYKTNSDLTRLNQAPLNQWIKIPEKMAIVIDTAHQISSLTDGALNITLGQAISQWGFSPSFSPPSTQHFLSLPSPIQPYYIRLKPAAVKKTQPISFNLSALAKGFAVDQASLAVKKLGIEHFILNAAGEIYAQGQRPDQQNWQIGLELPIPQHTIIYDQISLDRLAVATSGNYRRYKEIEGKRYSHLFDPKTAKPLQTDLLAVSVLHQSCMLADAFATALFALGAESGTAFCQRNKIAALFLIRNPEGITEIRTEQWLERLKLIAN